jgi:hypothetical protein
MVSESNTEKLRVIAPAVAEWPSWWRRNLTPGALYTIGAVVLSGVVVITTFIVSGHQDRTAMLELKESTKETNTRLGKIEGDIRAIQQWQQDHFDMKAGELRNPYVKSRPRLSAPPPPPGKEP